MFIFRYREIISKLLYNKSSIVFAIIIIIEAAWIKSLYSQSFYLDRYGFCREIQSAGATAKVFHCQLKNGSSYAVKRFRRKRKGITQEDYISSIRNEIDISARLDNKRIIPILDFFSERGIFYSVMPYIPTTLFDRCMGNGVPLIEEEESCIFRQIVDAVAYIHDQGVAHLDLKLNNILLENNTDVKLIDFGYSRRFYRDESSLVKG